MTDNFFSLVSILFLLMDPIGNIPIYVAILKDLDPKRQRVIIFRELVIALIAIILFYLIGNTVLTYLNISENTVKVSGGIILFIISLKLIFPSGQSETKIPKDKEPFIVPLAIPLVAGPAVLATVMIYSREQANPVIALGAIFIAWILSTIILLASSFLKKVLGERGLNACEKLMGLILVMLAVQMFLEGFSSAFKS